METIRERRIRLGLTIKDMMERSGMTRAGWEAVESGVRPDDMLPGVFQTWVSIGESILNREDVHDPLPRDVLRAAHMLAALPAPVRDETITHIENAHRAAYPASRLQRRQV